MEVKSGLFQRPKHWLVTHRGVAGNAHQYVVLQVVKSQHIYEYH